MLDDVTSLKAPPRNLTGSGTLDLGTFVLGAQFQSQSPRGRSRVFTFCPLEERGNRSADDFTPETNHQMIPEYLNVDCGN